METKVEALQKAHPDILPEQPQDIDHPKTIEDLKRKQALIRRLRFEVLKEGQHYGIIPGTGKPTLYKAGAEYLCELFRLVPRFTKISVTEDFDKPLFHYRYECNLFHMNSGTLVGSGIGSANSMESKYRWRKAKLQCPECNQESLIFTKRNQYWCVPDKGGCGKNFPKDDPGIGSQSLGKVENPDVFDQVNTIDKMAQKRAFMAATLICCGVSEFFTQDMDDYVPPPKHDIEKKSAEPISKGPGPAKSQSKVKECDDSGISPPSGPGPSSLELAPLRSKIRQYVASLCELREAEESTVISWAFEDSISSLKELDYCTKEDLELALNHLKDAIKKYSEGKENDGTKKGKQSHSKGKQSR